ncbi:hypothetical protein AN958_08826 [Leucoagaricus sp. SymC.cos]|nr:hypothetical protein AN958_08826 [Leucoagaricus sp. SymC.cos]
MRDIYTSEYSYRDQNHWIRAVAHTCCQWREIAFGCPTLWSIPIFTNPDLAQEMMSRSKKAALTIRCTSGTWTPRIIEQLENALTQMSRIETIHLTLAAQSDKLTNIFASLSQPAHLLEKVALSGNNYAMYALDKSLPQDAFTEVPRLRSIELERLDFTWQAAIFKHHSVTSLRLKYHRNYLANGTSTLGQMLDALANMPYLRILDLDHVIPLHTTISGNENVVQLQFLEKISIKARADDCNHFLRCIHYPPDVGITLHCHANSITEYAPIVSIVGQALRRTRDTDLQFAHVPHTLREAVIALCDANSLDINLYNKVRRRRVFYNPSLDEKPCVSIHLEGAHYVDASDNCLLKDIFASFDFPALKKFTLTWYAVSASTLRDCVGGLPQVEWLKLTGCFPEICTAMKENLEGRQVFPIDQLERDQTRSSTRRKVLKYKFPPVSILPALKTLHIFDADLRESRVPENMENLVDLLMQRSDMDAPVEHLILNGCHGVRGGYARKRLAEVVVSLEVDGEELAVEELEDDGEDDEETEYSDEFDEDEEHYSDEIYDYDHGYLDPYDMDEDGFGFGWLPF